MPETLGNTRIPIIQFNLPKDGGTISHLETYDSSNIKNLMQCGRGYLLRNIIGLREDEPNVHLEFGKAWAHSSYQMRKHMETGYVSYPPIPTQLHAIKAFKDSWNATYLEEDAFGIEPNADEIKNLITGLDAIQKYATHYYKEDFEVLEAEKFFGTLIDNETIVWGHKDGVIRDEFGIWGVEDKTAQFIDWGRAPLKKGVWQRMWDTNFQIGCYAFDGYQKHGPDFQGMIINGLHLYQKSKKEREENPFANPIRFEFIRIHSPRSYDQLVYWQDQARHWVTQIEMNLEILSDKSSSDQTLGPCFPPNGEYCSHYGCSFEGLCTLANPLQHVERWTDGNPPVGYEIRHWNPLEEKESVVEVKDLERLI